MNGLYKEENVSQPDNTINTLLKILSAAERSGADLPSGYRTPNALSRPPPITPDFRAEVAPTPEITPPTTPVLPDATPVVTPVLSKPPTGNAILNATASTTAPETKKPTNALLDYWANPVIGKMPLDKFVQIAGALSHAIAPQEAVGRVGNVLSQIGGQAYQERIKEPENVLRRRLLEAQITEAETPKEWGAFYKEHINTINPKTGKTFTTGETLKAFHEAQATPKEPQYDTDVQQDPTGKWQHGRRNKLTGAFIADRPATEAEIQSKVTGKIKEPKEYVPHTFIKPDGTIGWVEPGKEVPKGWKPYEKTGAGKETTPIQYWGVVSKIEDDARAYANVTVPKAAGGISFPAGGGIIMGGGIAKEDVDKWVDAYKSHYSRKVGEAKRMKALPEDYSTEPSLSTKVIPEADIEGGAISSRGKIVPPPKKQEPKGNTVQDVIKTGGKAVKMPDGSTHVFDKDGNYIGTAK